MVRAWIAWNNVTRLAFNARIVNNTTRIAFWWAAYGSAEVSRRN